MSKKLPAAKATIIAAWVAGTLSCVGAIIAATVGLGMPFAQRLAGQAEQKPIVIVITAPTPQSLVYQVYANRGWQDTGVLLSKGQQVTVEHISGLWFTGIKDGGGRDGSGGPNPWICSWPECHEPLHDFPKYALIGKVGNSNDLLKIGNHADFVPVTSGTLYLRPNYGDVDIAYFNPEGALTVRIIIH